MFVRCIAVLMLEPYNYNNLNMFVRCIAVLMLERYSYNNLCE